MPLSKSVASLTYGCTFRKRELFHILKKNGWYQPQLYLCSSIKTGHLFNKGFVRPSPYPLQVLVKLSLRQKFTLWLQYIPTQFHLAMEMYFWQWYKWQRVLRKQVLNFTTPKKVNATRAESILNNVKIFHKHFEQTHSS